MTEAQAIVDFLARPPTYRGFPVPYVDSISPVRGTDWYRRRVTADLLQHKLAEFEVMELIRVCGTAEEWFWPRWLERFPDFAEQVKLHGPGVLQTRQFVDLPFQIRPEFGDLPPQQGKLIDEQVNAMDIEYLKTASRLRSEP